MASLERMDVSGLEHGTLLAKSFWIRRFFRIYPLAISVILIVPIFHIPVFPGAHYSWPGIGAYLANLAIAQNLTFSNPVQVVLWSLPLEVQMYCFLPFLYFVIRRTKYRSLALWFISIILATTVPHHIARLSVLTFAPCFTAGIVGFDLSRTAKWKLPSWVWPIVILGSICLFGPIDNLSLYVPTKMYKAYVLSLLIGIAIPHVDLMKSPKLNRASHLVAKYSYGIYLSHTVVFWLAIYAMHDFHLWQRICVLVIGSILSPIVMFHALEHPFISLGSRISARVRSTVGSTNVTRRDFNLVTR